MTCHSATLPNHQRESVAVAAEYDIIPPRQQTCKCCAGLIVEDGVVVVVECRIDLQLGHVIDMRDRVTSGLHDNVSNVVLFFFFSG